jgi:hypothetical protein
MYGWKETGGELKRREEKGSKEAIGKSCKEF